jgi:hypothetical protein
MFSDQKNRTGFVKKISAKSLCFQSTREHLHNKSGPQRKNFILTFFQERIIMLYQFGRNPT